LKNKNLYFLSVIFAHSVKGYVLVAKINKETPIAKISDICPLNMYYPDNIYGAAYWTVPLYYYRYPLEFVPLSCEANPKSINFISKLLLMIMFYNFISQCANPFEWIYLTASIIYLKIYKTYFSFSNFCFFQRNLNKFYP